MSTAQQQQQPIPPPERQSRPKKDPNVFVKITASIVKSKVPSLFAPSGSTVHVIEVTNNVTNQSFKIGKTFSDFDLHVKHLQLLLVTQHSECDNAACPTLLPRTKDAMPPRTLMSRTPEVTRRREESFQNLLDLWTSFINSSRQSTCRTALADIPNALIVFLFDGAKMHKWRFWVPPSRSTRGKRVPSAVLDDVMRLAEEERQKAAAAIADIEDDAASKEGVADNDTILSVLRKCGSNVSADDITPDEDEQLANHLQTLRIALHQVDTLDQLAQVETEILEMIRQQRTRLVASAAEALQNYEGSGVKLSL